MIISSTNTIAAINSYDKLLSDDMRVASLNSLTSNARVTMKVHKCIAICQSDTHSIVAINLWYSSETKQQQHEKK
jgi:hypothetical protein